MFSQAPSSIPPPPLHGDRLKLSTRQRLWIAYLLALLLTLATLLIHLMIGGINDEPLSIILFIPVILLSAYLGGLGPGLAATALSCLITAYFLLPPLYSFAISSPIHALQWVSLCVIGLFISALSEGLHWARRKAQASQQVSALLAAIVESSDDAIIGKDLQGIISSWNASAERMFGYTASEIVGQPISLIIPPQRQDEEKMILARITRGERIDHFETVRQRKDGSLIDVAITVSPISDSNGQIIGASKVARDITARKRVEDALRRSEARFAIAFRANPTSMSITRLRDGRFIDINASHERLFGYARDELLGQSAGSIQLYADPDQRAEVVRIMEEQGSLHAKELTLRTKSGELREVLCSLEALELDGEACILGSVFDITARKHAEVLLQRSAEHLRVLADASRAFAEVGAEYETLLDHIAQTTTTVLGESCSIHLLSDDQKWLQIAALYDVNVEKIELKHSMLSMSPMPVDDPALPGRIFRSGQAQLIQVLEQEHIPTTTPQAYWSLVQRLGVHSVIAVPMRVQAQVIGVLIVSRHQPTRPAFDQDDLNLAQDLADRAALAISNARLLQQVQNELDKRTQAETALRTSEQRYRQIVETAQEGIWSIDAASRTTFANAKMAEILGYSIDEMIGTALFDFMDQEGQTIAAENIERRRQGIAEQHDFKFRHKNGSALWAMVSTNPLHNEAGTYIGALAMVTDITERKRAEEALRESEANLKHSQAIAHVGHWSWDTQNNHLVWSDEMYRIFGIDPQSFTGDLTTVIAQAIHPDDQQKVEHANESVIQNQSPASLEYRVIWPNQSVHTVSAIPDEKIIDSDGRIIRLTGIVQDITERKRNEVALERYTGRLQHLRAIDQAILASHSLIDIVQAAIGHIGDLIPSIRVALTLIDLAAQTMTLLAFHVRDELGVAVNRQAPLGLIDDMLDPLRRGQVYQVADVTALPELAALLRMARAEHLRAFFMIPILADGELVALLNVGADTPDAFSAEHIDIAREVADQLSIAIQQSRLREQIEQHANELEQHVATRTAELLAANKELEAFSYSVSHDLRAPLRAIDGFSRILLEDYIAELPTEAQYYFQLVRDNAQKMGHLVDDLLTFARLSRQPLSKRSVDPAMLVQQCLEELRDEQTGRQISIEIGELPACQADPALLKQVWINLIANALKYTRQREIAQIEIGSQVHGSETIYCIKDNGAGFDMRYSDKLFGVFQRMHRAEDYAGTGVGLAIVQRIVHRHGGRIWADAIVDHGATFYFTLGEDRL